MNEQDAWEDSKLVTALQAIAKYEDRETQRMKKDPVFKGLRTTPYWIWSDIPVEPSTINKLVLAGLVRRLGRRHCYLKDRKAVEAKLKSLLLAGLKKPKVKVESRKSLAIPKDLFDVIEGFEDLKDFIKIVLAADHPVHVLLEGPPGTAKSLMLMELERIGATFVTAGTATQVGIRDLLFDELPRILVIDELEKINNTKDLSTLLTWMESGRVIITKHNQHEERNGEGIVFAACNSSAKFPPELMDRFQVFKLKPYTDEQFIRVVTGYLTKRKKVKKVLAEYIANRVNEMSISVREAIRLSTLAKSTKDVDRILAITRRYQS